ncbi:hypothetical protein ABBQ32_008708 [Trebouxia sp. C0010 RCD-2024]
MPINSDHRSMFKKFLRLIEDELDANLGVPQPQTPPDPNPRPNPEGNERILGRPTGESAAEIFFRLTSEAEGGDKA